MRLQFIRIFSCRNQKINLFSVFLTFLVSTQGIEFQCDFTYKNWGIVGSVYTCYQPVVTIGNDPTTLEAVRGNHTEGKNNSDVIAIYILSDSTKLQRIPKKIEKFFPSLTALLWSFANLMAVTAEDLKPFPALRTLALHGHKIKTLDADLFQATPKISDISFTMNQITNVGQGIFDNLNELREIRFQMNTCIDSFATTPQAISTIKQQLLTQCPPLATTILPTTSSSPRTTTEDACNVRCTANQEIDQLKINLTEELLKNENQGQTIAKQNQAIEALSQDFIQLRETIDKQNSVISKSNDRILQIENDLKKILADLWWIKAQ